jgi:hypothetical protein
MRASRVNATPVAGGQSGGRMVGRPGAVRELAPADALLFNEEAADRCGEDRYG